MDFIEFVAVIKRHRLLVRAGLVAALLIAIFSSYRLDGTGLVSRSQPTYETTTVLAIKPGAAIPPLPAAVTPESVPVDTSVAPATTPTSAPGASDLDVVIDSRALYYSALSIQTAVVAPGFAERVNDALPTMDGSISAVVPLDTNTIRLVVDGSSPSMATATMQVALEQLQPLVNSYSTSGAFRFTLEAEVISGPSTPTSVSSIKGPLTATVVFGVAIVSLWLALRAYDLLQLHNRDSRHSSRIPQPRSDSSDHDLDPVLDETDFLASGADERGVDEPGVDEPGVHAPDVDELGVDEPDLSAPVADEPGVDDRDVVGPDVEVLASSDSESVVAEETPATEDFEPNVERVPVPSSRAPRRRRVRRDLEDETPSASPR